MERGNPVSFPGSFRAGETARRTDGDAGVRCRKKRMTAAFGQLMRLPPKGIVAVSYYRKVGVNF